MSEIRFQLDEHMSNAIADALKRAGADILTANEAGLRGQPDPVYIDRGNADGRVIETNDNDFLRLAHSHPDHAGIIFCASSRNITPVSLWNFCSFMRFSIRTIRAETFTTSRLLVDECILSCGGY